MSVKVALINAHVILRCRKSVLAEVHCYSVDSEGYYSQVKEFDFLADLDLNAPLSSSLANSSHPVSNT